MTTNSNVQILHVNICSLPHNFNEFLSFIQRQEIRNNIILLTETWLTDADEQLYRIPENCHLSINRLNRKWGGIRIYYLADLTVNKCQKMSGIFNTYESLLVKVSIKNKLSVTVGCINRPPLSIPLFNDYLNSVLFSNNMLLGKCILMGDFNIDYIKIRDKASHHHFADIMSKTDFKMLIQELMQLINKKHKLFSWLKKGLVSYLKY